MEKLSIFYTFFVLVSTGKSQSKKLLFLDSASDLEFNKPYSEPVAAAIAEKTPLLNSKLWT